MLTRRTATRSGQTPTHTPRFFVVLALVFVTSQVCDVATSLQPGVTELNPALKGLVTMPVLFVFAKVVVLPAVVACAGWQVSKLHTHNRAVMSGAVVTGALTTFAVAAHNLAVA